MATSNKGVNCQEAIKFEIKGVMSNIKEFFVIHDQYKQHIYMREHFEKNLRL